jgi:CRISPR-associated endonuclease Cas2
MSHIDNSFTLVCYDITSDKLRNKIDKAMKDFGTRIQYSIYLCRLDAANMDRCRSKLGKVLERLDSEKTPGDSLIIFGRLNCENADCLIGKRVENKMPNYGIF